MPGYPAALGVEERQVGEQVLLRASRVLVLFAVGGDAPGKRRRVGEDLKEFLVAAQRGVLGRDAREALGSLPAELPGVAVFDVVAEQVRRDHVVEGGLV